MWELAIEWSRKAVEACPAHGQKSKKSEYWRTISLCCLELFDYAQAKEAAKQACLLQPENGSSLSTYIFALDATLDHVELMNYVESLQRTIAKGDDDNLLTMALLANDSLADVLGHAARMVGKLDFVINACYTACEAALKDEDLEQYASQQLLLGQLLYTHNRDETKVIELWESVLKNKDAYSGVAETASARLSEINYRKATEAEVRGENPRPWVSKLEKLAKFNSKTKLVEASGSALIMGLWFREHDNLSQARKCCYTSVTSALDDLTNPDSDVKGRYAWTNLGEALLKAGDSRNAHAAYAIEMESFGSLDDIRLRSEQEAIETEKTEMGEAVSSEGKKYESKDVVDDALFDMKDLAVTTNDNKTATDGTISEASMLQAEADSLSVGLTKVTTKGIRPAHPPVLDRFPDAPALPGNTSWFVFLIRLATMKLTFA